MDDAVTHSCGLMGVFGADDATAMIYQGLQALQHRGQESAGIATTSDGVLHCERGEGLVTTALGPDEVARLPGRIGIGHVRYSTTGGPDPRNAQPLLVRYHSGPVAVAHNGDLTNKDFLRREGEEAGATFFTSSDTEVIVNLLARARGESFEEDLERTLKRLEGAYSLLFLRPGEIHAVRDPHGFRPLSLAKHDSGWIVASETCAFSLFDATYVRDIEPGEHLIIREGGLESRRFKEPKRLARCLFEHVYFARPDSRLFGQNVHLARVRMGEALAEQHPAEADLVIAVPESGNSAALGYSRVSGIPLERGFIKNHYIGRTFIKPSAQLRASSVRLKLAAVPEVLAGKRVVVVDDSVIRGTTTVGRIEELRKAGAREIHLRIACPPTSWPCYYGINFPTREELIAARLSVEEIRQHLGIDSLGYLGLDRLLACVRGSREDYCHACFSGEYPASTPSDRAAF